MPRKDRSITVPLSSELEEQIKEPLEFGDSLSRRVRELIRLGLEADGVDPAEIPRENDHRETDGGREVSAD